MRRLVTGVFAVALLSGAASAQDIALSKDEVRIPKGKSMTFEFGTVPQKDTTVLLDVLARLDSDGYGGSLYFMKIVLNGRVVQAAKTRAAVRLTNKSLVSPVASNQPYSWSDKSEWRVLYAPDFTGALKFGFYEGNPYQTVLDITDLINPAAENRLEIFNTCAYRPAAGAQGNYDLVLKDLTIRAKPGESPMMVVSAGDQDVVNRGAPGAGPAKYTGKLLPGGGFSLALPGMPALAFGSVISYPNAGLNQLAAAAEPVAAQPGFTVTVKTSAKGGQVIATGPDYRLVRTVTFTARKVEVSDQLTNLHPDAKLGLLMENVVELKGVSANVRLAGNADPSVNQYYAPGNPSVYVALKGLGLGLLCEDDVYRNQATLFFDNGKMRAGLRTDKLCLQPGGSYTLTWSVYPVASNDYYDFINLVRQDWGSNYTVEGAWTFFNPDTVIATPVEKLRGQFARQGITRACYCGGWVDHKADKKRIGFGTGVLDPYWSSFRDRLRQAAAKIREACPGCKVYVYYDTQRDTSEGGHARFVDSWVTDPKGVQKSTGWSGVYSLTYSVFATLTNTYGKAMLRAVDEYLSQMKIDGLYWDEMEGTGFGVPEFTCNVPDGFSCELDPKTHTLVREIGINTILGGPHRIAVIKRVRELGGDLMGNGPTARKDILALKPQRMIEIQHNEFWNYQGNLQSPLGYAGWRTDFGNWLRAINMATLLVSTRYDYPYDIQPYVFPFTPIELHAGYLLGKERIIAAHSGNYGWPGEKSLVQVRYFGANGKLTDRDFPTMLGKEAYTAVEVGKGEAVVLVRLPVTVRGTAGTVSGVQYGPEGLRLVTQTPQALTLEVRTGPMAIKPGQKFRVTLAGKEATVSADKAGILHVKCGIQGTVEIAPRKDG
ncbi:MAG: hypothetical protein PHV28_06000 [Kiritimatiellae bacterium]|nr:hypothetical protein [Kiritimatiellia bacterium]